MSLFCNCKATGRRFAPTIQYSGWMRVSTLQLLTRCKNEDAKLLVKRLAGVQLHDITREVSVMRRFLVYWLSLYHLRMSNLI